MAKRGQRTARAPAGRIVNLKPELGAEEVQDLLALAVGRPTPTRIEEVCQMYQFLVGWDLFGYRIRGDVVGCIGLQLLTWREGVVRHIAVAPEHRAQGIGRAMIGYVLRRFALTRLSAQADAEAVGFYRRCGFAATALPERYPGVERFQCVWEVESPGPAASSPRQTGPPVP